MKGGEIVVLQPLFCTNCNKPLDKPLSLWATFLVALTALADKITRRCKRDRETIAALTHRLDTTMKDRDYCLRELQSVRRAVSDDLRRMCASHADSMAVVESDRDFWKYRNGELSSLLDVSMARRRELRDEIDALTFALVFSK